MRRSRPHPDLMAVLVSANRWLITRDRPGRIQMVVVTYHRDFVFLTADGDKITMSHRFIEDNAELLGRALDVIGDELPFLIVSHDLPTLTTPEVAI